MAISPLLPPCAHTGGGRQPPETRRAAPQGPEARDREAPCKSGQPRRGRPGDSWVPNTLQPGPGRCWAARLCQHLGAGAPQEHEFS